MKTIFTAIGILLGVSLYPISFSQTCVTQSSQAVKDVARSYDSLTWLLERVHFFLQRVNRYTGVPLTDDIVELLGRIMAQVLSILALSTKAMVDGRISESNHLFYTSFLANVIPEKFLKRLTGRTEIEDAVVRLDMLTKEESLMMMAQNLEVTHRVDGKSDATKVLIEDINGNIEAIDHKLKTIKNGTQRFLPIFVLVLIHVLTSQTVTDKVERLSLHKGTVGC